MKKLFFSTFSFLILLGGAQAQEVVMNAHDFSFVSSSGKEIELSQYKGKTILVVNTASKCGFAPQFEGLQKLHETYADQGLVVLGVPSANFLGQEFDEIEKVEDFAQKSYQVTFDLAQIENVRGSDAHPFYKWAGEEAGLFGRPKWNFHKYLIGKDGRFVTYFGTRTKPSDKNLVQKIEELLRE